MYIVLIAITIELMSLFYIIRRQFNRALIDIREIMYKLYNSSEQNRELQGDVESLSSDMAHYYKDLSRDIDDLKTSIMYEFREVNDRIDDLHVTE